MFYFYYCLNAPGLFSLTATHEEVCTDAYGKSANQDSLFLHKAAVLGHAITNLALGGNGYLSPSVSPVINQRMSKVYPRAWWDMYLM